MRATRPLALGLLIVLAPAARASDELLAEAFEAKDVSGPLVADPAAALWDDIAAGTVFAAPQRTIHLNDRAANAALAEAAPRTLAVRAAFDGRDLAVAVDWSDSSEDRVRPEETDAFGDGAALEIPIRFGAGLRLPYVGMGDEEMPVILYRVLATAGGTIGSAGSASGFGSLARKDPGAVRVGMRYDTGRKTWRAVFVRPLVAGEHDVRHGLVPFALAVWDGARHERGGNKALTGWRFLRMPRYALDSAYVAEMSHGRAPGDLGDPARGKLLVESVCAACHAVGDRRIAPPGIAPDLTTIGAISTPGYLRDSLLEPSAVIVPNPNPHQHYVRSKTPGASGAFPSNDAFVWYRRDPGGKKISKMPAFGTLPKADLDAIVAYMMTLGVPAAGERRQP